MTNKIQSFGGTNAQKHVLQTGMKTPKNEASRTNFAAWNKMFNSFWSVQVQFVLSEIMSGMRVCAQQVCVWIFVHFGLHVLNIFVDFGANNDDKSTQSRLL